MKNKDLFKKHKENKIKGLFKALEKHSDILLACRDCEIDYFVLANWMKLDNELCEKIKILCSPKDKEALRLFDGKLAKKLYKKSPEIINAIFQSLQNGAGICKACEFAGVTYLTFRRWLSEDKELEKAFNEIKESNIHIVENAFYQKLLSGKADTLAYIFFLTNKMPESWKNRQELLHEIGESTIERLENLSVQQLKERANVIINRIPRININ